MAKRPVFVPHVQAPPFVRKMEVEFQWYPGMAKSQAQKSIASLHASAAEMGVAQVLEISSKSPNSLGVSLSAFNLCLRAPNGAPICVESAFQGSKVFAAGGPYVDLYDATGREAKTDERLRTSGDVVAFSFYGEAFPTRPRTAFYDWLYFSALVANPRLAQQIVDFDGFTDIAYNPKKSWNCQARAAAQFVALHRLGEVERAAASGDAYLAIVAPAGGHGKQSGGQQLGLPF